MVRSSGVHFMPCFKWVASSALVLAITVGASAAWADVGCSAMQTAMDAASLAAAITCANARGDDTTIEILNPIDITGVALPAITNTAATIFTGSPIKSTTATGVTDLQQLGTGVTQLNTTGLSTYTGGTSVAQGTLQAGSTDAFGPLSDYTVNNPGTLDLNNRDQTIGSLSGNGAVTLGTATLTVGQSGQNTTFSGVISGSGGVTLDPSQGYSTTLTNAQQNVNFTLQGAQQYTGTTTIDVGFLILNNGASVRGPIQINSGTTPSGDTYGGTLVVSGSAGAVTVPNAISGPSGILVGNEQVTFTGDLSGYAGRIQVDGSQANPGSFIVGTDSFGNNAVNVVVDANGTFDLNGHAVTIQGIGDGTDFGANPTNVGTVLLNGGTLTLGIDNAPSFNVVNYFAGTIADGTVHGGQLVKVGNNTLELVAANSFSGGTQLDAGQITIGNAAALGTGRLTMADGTTLAFENDPLFVNNPITLTSGQATIDSGAGFGVLQGVIGGAGMLVKAGTGSLGLTATDTYTGGTAIDAGILQIGAGGTTGSIVGDVTDNAALIFARSDTISFGGVISGSGYVKQAYLGTLILTGANTYTGGSYITLGTVQVTNSTLDGSTIVSSSIGTGPFRFFDGTLQAGADLTLGNAITVNTNGGTIDNDGHSFTLAGAITDGTNPGGLTFINSAENAAATVLSGANTFASGATVTGTVDLGADNALGSGALIVNGHVDLAGFDQANTTLNGSGLIISTGLAGASGTLTVQSGSFAGTLADGGAGTLGLTKTTGGILVLSGTSTYSGPTAVAGGTLQAGSTTGFSPASSVTVAGGATLDLAGFASQVGSLAGAGTVTNSGLTPAVLTAGDSNASTTFAGALSDGASALGLTKAGTGTLTLTGANTYTGGTTIAVGTLVGSATSFGSGPIIDDAALVFDQGTDAAFGDGLPGSGPMAKSGIGSLGSGTMPNGTALGLISRFAVANGIAVTGSDEPASDDGVNADPISGSGTVTKTGAGILTLTGANTYTGGTTVAAGTLVGSTASFGSGPIVDNAALVFDQDADAAFGNGISGSGTVTKTGAGSLTLTGADSYTGGTTVSAGTLIGSAASFGSGAIVDNAALVFVQATDASVGSAISGSGTVIKAGAGSLTLTTDSSYTGGTKIAGGTLDIMTAGALGSGTLSMANGTTLGFLSSFTLANAVTFTGSGDPTIDTGANTDTISGVITGPGALTKIGTGTLTLAGSNTYTGGTTVAAGTLIGSTTSFGTGGILDDSALVIDQPTTASYAAAISGTGSLTKSGAGTLDLTGTSTLSGATTVAAGTLLVDGSLATSPVTVTSGTTLGGFGTVGGIVALAGSTVAPGAAVPFSTLHVAGNVAFASGSTYQVAIDAAGKTDLIAATGTATIAGGTVDVLAGSGIYSLAETYTIVTAAGGRTGTFNTLATTSNLAFLQPFLSYDPNDVTLGFTPKMIAGKPVTFPSVAKTPNERESATAIQALGAGNPLYDTVLSQSVTGAQQAFKATSGEAHASATTTAIQATRMISGLVFDRLWNVPGSGGDDALSAIDQFRPTTLPTLLRCYAADTSGGSASSGETPSHYTVWGQAIGNFGRSASDGNASSVSRTLGGFVLGADTRLDAKGLENWQVGVTGGYTNTQFTVHDGGGTGTYENAFGGLFAGARYGAVDIRLGAAYGGTATNTHRVVAFPGFNEAERSSYGGDTAQAFGEIGYRLAFGNAVVEPVLDASVTHVHQDRYREKGGDAALLGFAQDVDVESTVLGFRGEATPFAGLPIVARLFLGWQHAYGDVNPAATVAFAAGASAFQTYGAPVDRNTAVAEAGLDWRATNALTLGVSYVGQIGPRDLDNAVKGQAEYRF